MSQAQKDAWEEYLTEKQVADRTNICLSTLRNWRVLGKGIPYTKPNGTLVRYRLSDVRAFMEEVQVDPSGEAA